MGDITTIELEMERQGERLHQLLRADVLNTLTEQELHQLVAIVGRLMVNLTNFEVEHFSCWTSQARKTAKLDNRTRCPYCVAGGEFKLMFRSPRGWLVCQTCGHIAIPEQPDFKCPCRKCKALNRAP